MPSFTGTVSLEMRQGDASIDVTKNVKMFRWTESLLIGGFSWEMVFQSEMWEQWTDLLLGRDSPRVWFRLKTQEGEIGNATEWRTAIVDTSRSAFRGSALEAAVSGGDARLKLRADAHTRAWPQSTVADIAKKIASAYNLDAVVDETLGRRDRWQLREDDWTFLNRLVKETASDSGRGDLYLWVDENELHLAAPNLSAPSDRRHDLSQQEARVNRVVVAYAGRQIDRMGGGTLRGIGYDLDNNMPLSFDVNAQAVQSQPALAKKVPRAQDGDTRIIPVYEEAQDLVEARARAWWGKVAPRYFSLRLDSRPDILLRPGSIIEAQVNLDAERQTPLLGRFVVLEVEHNLIGGGLETTAVCYRREAFEGDDDPTGASVSSGSTRDQYQFGEPDEPRTVLTAESLD